MDIGYGDSHTVRDVVSYDEGRAIARSGLSCSDNPFIHDLESSRQRSWTDGSESTKVDLYQIENLSSLVISNIKRTRCERIADIRLQP